MPNTSNCRHFAARSIWPVEIHAAEETPPERYPRLLDAMLLKGALQNYFWGYPSVVIHFKEEKRYQEVDQTERTFCELANRWRDETAHVSSSTQMVLNSNYQRIIGMGRPVIPIILRHLKTNEPDHWFWALASVTRENPIKKEDAGDVEKMSEAWIQWGEERGFI